MTKRLLGQPSPARLPPSTPPSRPASAAVNAALPSRVCRRQRRLHPHELPAGAALGILWIGRPRSVGWDLAQGGGHRVG